MHKKIFLLILFTLLLTACTKINNNNYNNYDIYINNIIKNKNNYTNSTSIGYKYYLPKGVSLKKDNSFNVTFCSRNVNLYLYADIVSYYHKKKLNLDDSINYDYFSRFENNNKEGYIAINKDNNLYYVKIVYNYSKIEFYTDNNLSKLINLSTIILNSIEYKDIMIEKILENSSVVNAEISYQIDDFKQGKSNFSQYLNEYISDVEKKDLPESE